MRVHDAEEDLVGRVPLARAERSAEEGGARPAGCGWGSRCHVEVPPAGADDWGAPERRAWPIR